MSSPGLQQVADAVTQTNVKVVAEGPAVATTNLYVSTSQALGNGAHNATAAQQNGNTILQTTTTQGIALLFGVDTASTAVGIAKIMNSV